MTGTTILHYRVGDRIGAGGMGHVYRAEDLRLGRTVALKFLTTVTGDDPDGRARFLREARAASMLQSPHIVSTYDIGEHGDEIFIVMEHVEGEPLSARVARGALSVPDAVDIGAQIADALDEAHARGVVHRDIKSANVLITGRGLVKVVDFGLAKMFGPATAWASAPTLHTAGGLLLGTVSFMSPEQALGRAVDGRSDIFSLGVVLYQMLAGRLPFDAATVAETLDNVLHHDPPRLRDVNAVVPPALEDIVARALARNPADRYQQAADLRADLLAVAEALRSDSRARASRALAPRPAAPSGPATVAVLTFANITREAADDWIGAGIAETVTADLKSVPGLSVVGRERVFELLRTLGREDLHESGTQLAIDLGRRLGVASIIAGGYQRVGDLLRITARILDMDTGAVLRTVKIDGRIADIFDLQDRIVTELSGCLGLRAGQPAPEAIPKPETRSLEAYEAHARGMLNLRQGGRDSLERAIYHFEKATEIDPDYAVAWASLARAYGLKATFLSLPELNDKAMTSARRAIALAPDLATAYVQLGQALFNLGRYDEALAAVQEAVRLEPDNALARSALGRAYWAGQGMIDEGIAELERTIAINPEAGYAYLQLGLLYALRGDFEKGEAVCRRAIELQERNQAGTEGLQIAGAHTRLGYIFYRQRRFDEAIQEYERELAFISSGDHVLRERTLIELSQKLGAAALAKGDDAETDRWFSRALAGFDQLVARGAADPYTTYYIAALHALRGDAERAAKLLAQAVAQLTVIAPLRARLDPDFDPVRADPRIQALLSDNRTS